LEPFTVLALLDVACQRLVCQLVSTIAAVNDILHFHSHVAFAARAAGALHRANKSIVLPPHAQTSCVRTQPCCLLPHHQQLRRYQGATRSPPDVNMPTLLTLPKELQLQITEYVSEQKGATASATVTDRDQLGLKSDLKNLCLVCKEMRDVGTPILFKDMVLHVDKLSSDFRQVTKTTKTEAHRGLPHVRTLRVVSKNSGDFVSSRRYKMLCQLIAIMPRDILTRFE
jgi:hypothetical protein